MSAPPMQSPSEVKALPSVSPRDVQFLSLARPLEALSTIRRDWCKDSGLKRKTPGGHVIRGSQRLVLADPWAESSFFVLPS